MREAPTLVEKAYQSTSPDEDIKPGIEEPDIEKHGIEEPGIEELGSGAAW